MVGLGRRGNWSCAGDAHMRVGKAAWCVGPACQPSGSDSRIRRQRHRVVSVLAGSSGVVRRLARVRVACASIFQRQSPGDPGPGGFGTRRAAPKPLGFFASARPYSKKILPKFCSSKVHCALLSPDRALLLQEQKKICSKKRPKISSSEKKCLTLCCRTTHPRIVGNVGAVRFQRLNFVTRVDAI